MSFINLNLSSVKCIHKNLILNKIKNKILNNMSAPLNTMFSPVLSNGLMDRLYQITSDYEEYLKTAFGNEGLKRINSANSEEIKLSDVLVTIDNNIVELHNLILPTPPDFRVEKFSVELDMLTLNIALKLGNVSVIGDYIANNKSLHPFLPITHTGKIDFTLENVTASGRVGILITEDSFTVENYDIEYRTKSVSFTVSYFKDNSQVPIVSEVIGKELEETLANTFWTELSDTFTLLLHLQLDAVIVEDSVTQLLSDRYTELMEFSLQQTQKANQLLDSLLTFAKHKIVASGTQSLNIPELEVLFLGGQGGQQQGSLTARNGYMQDLTTISRIKNMSLYENEIELIIYGSIRLGEFKFGYEKYISQYLKVAVEGHITGIVNENDVFIKVTVFKAQKPNTFQLSKIKVRTLKNIKLDASGLGILNWLTDKIQSWTVGVLRQQGLPILEQNLASAFEHAVKYIDCQTLLN